MGFFDFFGLSAEDELILRDAIKFLRENGLNDYCDKVERDTGASRHLVKLQKGIEKTNKLNKKLAASGGRTFKPHTL